MQKNIQKRMQRNIWEDTNPENAKKIYDFNFIMVSFVFIFSIRGKQSIFNTFDCKAFKLETKK